MSDKAGILAFSKLKFIVILATISDHVPESGETTAIALIAAISNFTGGSFLSPMVGSWIIDGLGIESGNYGNLPWAILIRTLVRLLPIPFLAFLVPTGSSLDKTRFDVNDLEISSATDEGKLKGEKEEDKSDDSLLVDTKSQQIFQSLSSSLYHAVPEPTATNQPAAS